jgi:crotonobetainyl-CoA:carnitine CoA-transferase CaiB-like acyl-CoA transferase
MKPLQGIRVIDVTMWAFCPSAAAILASWGADVVHVENPASPDPMRIFAGGSVEPGYAHWMFKHYNRGKRSVAINLAAAEGQGVVYTLVGGADVFVTFPRADQEEAAVRRGRSAGGQPAPYLCPGQRRRAARPRGAPRRL